MSETQKTIDSLAGITGVKDIDRDAVLRFVNDTINDAINRRAVDPSDAVQAAVLLGAVVKGLRGGDDMGKELRRLLRLRKKKQSQSKVDPGATYINSPAWNIVANYVRGEIRHVDAKKLMMAEALVGDREAARLLAVLKPKVKQTLARQDTLFAIVKKSAAKGGGK